MICYLVTEVEDRFRLETLNMFCRNFETWKSSNFDERKKLIGGTTIVVWKEDFIDSDFNNLKEFINKYEKFDIKDICLIDKNTNEEYIDKAINEYSF